MNEAFEKILERLEESYIDCFHQGDYKFNNAIDKAEQIVREVAEEFATDTNVGTNGWIPCSDGLPDIEADVLITLRNLDIYTGFRASTDGYFYVEGTDEGYIPFDNVVAWQPLPEPYLHPDWKQ